MMKRTILAFAILLLVPLAVSAQIEIPLNQPYYCYALTHSTTTVGLVNADSTPTYAVLENGTDTAIVTGNLVARAASVGEYYLTFNATAANGFELGKMYVVRVAATVEGFPDKEDCPSFRVVATEATTGYKPPDPTALTEQAQGTPTATPTLPNAVMYLYMALRNQVLVTNTLKSFTNDAGVVIYKKTLSDNGTTFTESEAVSGP